MSFGMVAAAGVGLIGSSMIAGAAGDASAAQAQAAAQSDATQRYMYDTTRADNAPFLANGTAASNKLAFLLGVGGGAANGAPSTQFVDTSTGVPAANSTLYATNADYRRVWDQALADHRAHYGTGYEKGSDAARIDEYLRGAMAPYMDSLPAQEANNQYGSLLRKFSASDLAADPVYQSGLQFGLSEGEKGIQRQAAATGSSLSGATLKALTRFGNDYGSTKANDAYNRFNNDNTTTYNRLAGVAGSGQTASSQVGAAGQNMANNVSASQQAVGNARAASSIASGNAWANGITGAYNNIQQNQLMDRIFPRQGGGGGSPWASFGTALGQSGIGGADQIYG